MQLVAENDTESFTSNSAFLGDTLQSLSSTPISAMIAKQIQNAAVTNKLITQFPDRIVIGEAGKTSIKEVSSFLFLFCFYFILLSILFLQYNIVI